MVMFKARFDDVTDKPGARADSTRPSRRDGPSSAPRPQAAGWREAPGWHATAPAPAPTAPPVEKERGPQVPVQEPPGSAEPPQRA